MILVLGDIILDKFFLYKFHKKSQEANIPIVIKENNELKKLGGAANLINNINKINKKCILISRLGKNANDKNILDMLKYNRIKAKIFFEKNYTVSVKTRHYIDNNQIFRLDQEKNELLKRNTEKKIIDYIKYNIERFKILIISDYNKGLVSKNLLKEIVKLFNSRKKLIITNPKKNNINFYKGTNIIVPNEKEFNMFFKSQEKFKKKIESFFKNKYLNHLIITRGSKSLLHFDNQKKKIQYNVKKIKTFDVTGASDTFIAILALNLYLKNSISKAIKKSILAATKVVQKRFTSTVSKKEYYKL